ncbi:ATP-dependent helicase HrpA [Pseudomonas sp. 22526]|uniref:ATP-dependent helicase HrpA n=1 Tax=Pseudomonas sp. 22526 TaxID=3453937 RepID=UPI003F866641
MAMGASLAASMAAQQQMDQTSAATTTMNAQAQSQKMMTDTINGIASAYQDSATKAQNAAQQTGKSINY